MNTAKRCVGIISVSGQIQTDLLNKSMKRYCVNNNSEVSLFDLHTRVFVFMSCSYNITFRTLQDNSYLIAGEVP
jgi:hypothetical protein